MPYGSSYRRTYRRKSTYRKYRKSKSSTIPPKKKTTRTYVRKNALVNRRQARQIKFLMQARYGQIQRNVQLFSNQIGIQAVQPILFDASDFTSERTATGGQQSLGCRIWQVSPTGSSILQVGHWSTAFFNQNVYWNQTNKDLVGDTGYYKPVSAYYTFTVNCRTSSDAVPPKFRIDLFTQISGFWPRTVQPTEGRIMPWGLPNLTSMAQGVNHFNPSYFKKYKTLTYILNKHTAQIGAGSDDHNYTFTLGVHPKKVRNMAESFPDVPGTTEQESGVASLGSVGAYNVSPKTPLWIMCSSSNSTPDTRVTINCKRVCTWRDSVGATHILP